MVQAKRMERPPRRRYSSLLRMEEPRKDLVRRRTTEQEEANERVSLGTLERRRIWESGKVQ